MKHFIRKIYIAVAKRKKKKVVNFYLLDIRKKMGKKNIKNKKNPIVEVEINLIIMMMMDD